jgi:hypothetical protein
MCEWNTNTICRVPILAELSYDGKFRWDDKAIDSCIAPLVNALNEAGIYTASCCCGHGEMRGHIWLHDGRILVIVSPILLSDDGEKKDKLIKYLKYRF